MQPIRNFTNNNNANVNNILLKYIPPGKNLDHLSTPQHSHIPLQKLVDGFNFNLNNNYYEIVDKQKYNDLIFNIFDTIRNSEQFMYTFNQHLPNEREDFRGSALMFLNDMALALDLHKTLSPETAVILAKRLAIKEVIENEIRRNKIEDPVEYNLYLKILEEKLGLPPLVDYNWKMSLSHLVSDEKVLELCNTARKGFVSKLITLDPFENCLPDRERQSFQKESKALKECFMQMMVAVQGNLHAGMIDIHQMYKEDLKTIQLPYAQKIIDDDMKEDLFDGIKNAAS